MKLNEDCKEHTYCVRAPILDIVLSTYTYILIFVFFFIEIFPSSKSYNINYQPAMRCKMLADSGTKTGIFSMAYGL